MLPYIRRKARAGLRGVSIGARIDEWVGFGEEPRPDVQIWRCSTCDHWGWTICDPYGFSFEDADEAHREFAREQFGIRDMSGRVCHHHSLPQILAMTQFEGVART